MLLYLYNLLNTLLWTTIVVTRNTELLYYVQHLGFMDVILAMTKVIPSKPHIVFLQIMSRIVVLHLTKYEGNELLCLVWGCADLVRYLFQINKSSITTFLRYNCFWVLYPIGMGIELFLLIFRNNFYNQIFLTGDFISTEVVNAFWICLYSIVGPMMYSHMVLQNHKMKIVPIISSYSNSEKYNYTIRYSNMDYRCYIDDINVFRSKIENVMSVKFVEENTSIQTITIKDLGLQISWRLVFIIEYLGPFLIGLGLYNEERRLMTILWSFHYLKRILETIFVHIFSMDTMPISNLFKNSLYYWGATYWIMSRGIDNSENIDYQYLIFFWILVWILAQIGNFCCHLHLSNLRGDGKDYQLPTQFPPFRYFVCPNYTFEIVGWLLFSVIFQSWEALVFTLVGAVQMYLWGRKKRSRYNKLFGDKYRVRNVIFPFL